MDFLDANVPIFLEKPMYILPVTIGLGIFVVFEMFSTIVAMDNVESELSGYKNVIRLVGGIKSLWPGGKGTDKIFQFSTLKGREFDSLRRLKCYREFAQYTLLKSRFFFRNSLNSTNEFLHLAPNHQETEMERILYLVKYNIHTVKEANERDRMRWDSCIFKVIFMKWYVK